MPTKDYTWMDFERPSHEPQNIPTPCAIREVSILKQKPRRCSLNPPHINMKAITPKSLHHRAPGEAETKLM